MKVRFFNKKDEKGLLRKTIFSFIALAIVFSFSLAPRQVSAQLITADPGALAQAIKSFFETKIGKAIQKAGSLAFQRTLSTSLNKIAHDTASYIGSGGRGQDSLYIKEDWGTYLKNVGDAAAGQFLESFVQNLDFSGKNSQGNCEALTKACYEDCYKKENGGSLAGFNVKKIEDATKKTTSLYPEKTFTSGLAPMQLRGICYDECGKAATSCSAQQAYGATRVVDKGQNANAFNVCQPSSMEAKLKISLGLVDYNRPSDPNCTASDIISNWGDGVEGYYNKLASIQDGTFFNNFGNYFDPRGNDLSIYMMAQIDLEETKSKSASLAHSGLQTNDGWLEVRDIAGIIQGTPQNVREMDAEARAIRVQNFGKTTGDILIDAANIFLNQLAITAYNNLMRNLTDKKDSVSLTEYAADPGASMGESSMREKTRILLDPQFDTKSDFNILSDLFSCMDSNNPGPNNCVIDDRFMQAIIEQKTVGEAIKEGYLNPDWRIEFDYLPGAHNNHFSLRNIKILRKYRILPLGFEAAIERAFKDGDEPKKATLGDLVACFDQNDEYDKFSAAFEVRDLAWCNGLVDPKWVLKAPLNYCKREGAGSQILNSFIVPGIKDIPATADILSELMILRDDNYCADNQSCIKEGVSGGCDLYGYCTEEKRTWEFDNKSCSPLSNTCQTFTNISSNQSFSYLENTIDYGDCNADNAGCKRYSTFGAYNANGTVAWDTNYSLFLNKNLQSCNSSAEGCTELMRVKPTWGSNLIIDSEFALSSSFSGESLANWSVTGSASLVDMSSEVYGQESSRVLKISGQGAALIRSSANVFPSNLQILANQNYTLSADVYLAEGENVQLILNPGDRQALRTISARGQWYSLSVTASSPSGFSSPDFLIAATNQSGANNVVYIKNIKFELGDWSTAYSTYGSYKINQKLLPRYLEEACYVDTISATKNYSLKGDAPSVCLNYARKCNASEVGCELYSGVYNNLKVPAQVASSDYCPKECSGYDLYIARETYFNPAESENIIPSSTEKCSQQAVGCNEFTNLDEIARGGEGKEYYVFLKQCIKPDESKCSDYYAWENAGLGDLTRYTLQKGLDGNPLSIGNASEADCSDIYNLPLSDPNYDPDCKQFLTASGDISYRFVSKVVTCSENCHSYRLSSNNIDKNIRSSSACSGSDKHWNATASVCYVCKNGGVWDNSQNACLYQAIPSEGQICSAQNSGCREYNGSNGNSTRIVSSFDFNKGIDPWYSNCSGGVSDSQISNEREGASLSYNYGALCGPGEGGVKAKVRIGSSLREGYGYTIRFIARSQVEANVKIFLKNEVSGEEYYFNSSLKDEDAQVLVKGGNSWNVYNINLENLTKNLGAGGTLNISANVPFLIDDIVLTEISDRYYLKKGSGFIPDICYYDNLGNYQGPDYNLGCAQYTDRDNLNHYLHNFSALCSANSVGCEQMIDTKNYNSPDGNIWNDTNLNGSCDNSEEDCVKVDKDSVVYAVYDRSKACLSADLGCSRMGQASGVGAGLMWSDVSRKNNPNNYDISLCSYSDIGCEEYKMKSGGISYFKDPVNNLCIFRSSNDPLNSSKSWFKVPVKRCDFNSDGVISGLEASGSVCASDNDCDRGVCISDNNDYECSVSYLKTIGFGGTGGAVPVPNQSTALCEANSSGCTEYIDPVSKFNPNLVRNPKYESYGTSNYVPSWGEDSWMNGSVSANEQVVKLERNKLYSFSAKDSASGNYLNGSELAFARNSVRTLGSDNNFSTTPTNNLKLTNTNQPIIFNTFDNYSAKLTRLGGDNVVVEIKELLVDYQIKDSVNKSACSVADFDSGCILFNERSINGASGLKKNIYNAVATSDGKSPVLSSGPYSANQLLKVSPDRVCAKWLTCTSYGLNTETGHTSCYSLGECNTLDEQNQCANVINYSQGESRIFDPEKDKNASGYALPNMNYYSDIKELGLNTTAHFDFEESVPALSCYNKRTALVIEDNFCLFDGNIVNDVLVREPVGAPTDYPAKGKTYLKVNGSQFISPQGHKSYIQLSESGTYYINFLVNTKGSSANAEILIYNLNNDGEPSGIPVKRIVSSANNGWERKTESFVVNSLAQKIGIFLSAAGSNTVYFDDINIEPVLKIGENNGQDILSARDCRLYPTSESMNCFDNSNAVIRNGLEGYCLEYDLANPKVCQLWLPLDKIASSQLPSVKSGYTGKFPLNYCAEVDTNFVFMEKRKAAIVKQEIKQRNDVGAQGVRHCFYPGNSLDYCVALFGTGSSETRDFVEEEIRNESGSDYEVVVNYGESGSTATITGGSKTDSEIIEKTRFDVANQVLDVRDNDSVVKYCGDSGNYFLLKTQDLKEERGWFVRDDVAITYVCVPIDKDKYEGYTRGRYEDRGSLIKRYVPAIGEKILMFDDYNTFTPITDGWYISDGFDSSKGSAGHKDGETPPIGFDEANNANPPVRVWDKNYAPPASEDELKKISSKDPDEVFRLTCNKFVEVVSGSGENMAYSSRTAVGSDYKINSSGLSVTYNNYIRRLGDIPFGAASWPNDFNLVKSPRVPLYNQYSLKNNENVFAGRPYGCDILTGGERSLSLNNCSMVGYCSGNPDMYCLVDNALKGKEWFGKDSVFYLAHNSCGSFGICQPLWTPNSSKLEDLSGLSSYDAALNQIFLKSYNAYEYKAAEGGYVTTSGYKRTSSISSQPSVSNIKLYSNNSRKFIVDNDLSKLKSGNYRLEFNTSINEQQQPLKQIVIDWGDFMQVIIDENEKNKVQSPHIFYHYYSDVSNLRSIKIKVIDNWGVSSTFVPIVF